MGEQIPVDRNRQRLPQDGQVVVDRLRRKPRCEFAGLVALDLTQHDLIEFAAAERRQQVVLEDRLLRNDG